MRWSSLRKIKSKFRFVLAEYIMIRPMYLSVEEYNRGVRGGAFAAIPIYLCKKTVYGSPAHGISYSISALYALTLRSFSKHTYRCRNNVLCHYFTSVDNDVIRCPFRRALFSITFRTPYIMQRRSDISRARLTSEIVLYSFFPSSV